MSKITTIRKVKQDDKFSIAIRDIQSQHPANKKCFDCDQRGPTYVNMTIGSFVCTKCSGLLRGINPPHRIKSISMSTFSNDEVEMMRSKGNAWCAAVWCGTYNKANYPVDFKDDEKIKEFIISKYEKKRYYVDPSQANFSSIKTQLTGGSTGSGDSHGSYKLSSSSLIGSTLKARVDPSSVLGQSSVGPSLSSSVVSRPDILPQVNMTISHPPPPDRSQVNMTISHATLPDQSQVDTKKENFANFDNFADFDGAAFDSMPPDPLTLTTLSAPSPASTLPPINKKVTADPANTQAQNSGDKYSALKELDDLFRTTNITEPAPASAQPDLTGGLFASNPAPIPTIPTIPTMANQSHQNGLWGTSSSPATSSWLQPASSPLWAGDSSSTTTGWPDSANKRLTPGNTNPFGTSPSTTTTMGTMGQVFSDNNNDLFAAAPKPFISEKPGGLAGSSGNPWSSEAVSASTFTQNMVPAHNPNNPFL